MHRRAHHCRLPVIEENDYQTELAIVRAACLDCMKLHEKNKEPITKQTKQSRALNDMNLRDRIKIKWTQKTISFYSNVLLLVVTCLVVLALTACVC